VAKKAKVKKGKAKKASPKKAKAQKVVKKAVAAKKKTFRPPYKCQKTLIAGVCLKFRYNSSSGQYDLGGDKVDCGTCEYFM
jgi:hypothetical protein